MQKPYGQIWWGAAQKAQYFHAVPLQDILSQTGERNLALREGRKDISDILWHFFQQNNLIST